MKIQLKEEYEVQVDDIDFSSQISLLGLARHMQNIAANHAAQLGFNYYKDGTEPKYYWVLSRVKYMLHKSIGLQEKFSLTTYSGGCDKLFAVRLFDIRDEEDQLIGHIIGDYILIDAEKGRPTRITNKESIFDVLNFKYEGEQLDKLAPPEEIIAEEVRKARYSEIDLNGHMNNVQYIKWILDMLSLEMHKEKQIETLQINYNTSVMYEDQVKVVLGTIEGEEGYRVAGMSLDGTINYFTAHMVLKAR